MKHYLLTAMLIVSSIITAKTITGKVIDQNGEVIPFATISVLDQDSIILTGAITDENGIYKVEFNDNNYILQASFVGYTTVFGGPDFTLKEETEQLSEVEVKAKRPLIERQFDKLVVNVSQSPLSAGSNGNDILRRAPGVRIDKDGNITVNGKSVEIYIDGKPSYMNGQQLKAMLDGTDGNTIEKIEIISNPSAKYDASGQGGIINIKIKSNMMQGLNGMLSAAYGGMYFSDIQKWLQMDMVSLNLNYRSKYTYTFGQLTQVYASGDQTLETGRTLPATALANEISNYSNSGYSTAFQYYMLRAGNDWYIDSLNTLGFILQIPYVDIKMNLDSKRNYAYSIQGADTIEKSITTTNTHIKTPQYSANLNYTHTFSESLEREITTNIDYNRYTTNNSNQQKTDYLTHSLELDIASKQQVDIYSGKIDFQTKFWHTGLLECGIKYAISSTDNNMKTDSTLNGLYISRTPSDFKYQEHVAAAYITAAKQFGEHWSVKLGIRTEYTYSHGDWRSADSVTTKSYIDPFPTAYISYTSKPMGNKLQQPIGVGISYSRRIKRPNYFMLNPFITYLDAYALQVGNTDLSPEFNNDVEMQFSWTQHLNATLNFSHTQDMFSQRITVLPNGIGEMKWVNFGTCTTYGGNISLTELPIVPKFVTTADGSLSRQGAWVALTVNAGCYHSQNKSYEKTSDGKPSFNVGSTYGYAGGTLSAYLPKDWTLSSDFNWTSPMTIGYNHQSSNYYMSIGIRKMLMQHGLIFNLNVQDVLRSMVFKSVDLGNAEGYKSWSRSTLRHQRVVLSITWMFGQQQQYKHRRVGELDESSRLGGNEGIGAK